MPCRSPGYRGFGDGSQSLEKAGLELPTLVGCDLLGTAETSNPDGDEGFSDCFGGKVRQRECLRPMGVSVDSSETVPEARIDRQRPHQVDMHMRETCRRDVETPGRGVACTYNCACARVAYCVSGNSYLFHHRELQVSRTNSRYRLTCTIILRKKKKKKNEKNKSNYPITTKITFGPNETYRGFQIIFFHR